MSESEEMYLVSIFRANEIMDGPVPLTRLASELDVQPVSVNQMVKKLEEAGKVIYVPYKGVSLSTEGKKQALHILRHRRLWEVFLVEKLHFTPQEADAVACKLEHVVPDGAMERLAEMLGHPSLSPAGAPIPPVDSDAAFVLASKPLSSLGLNETGVITQIRGDAALRAFLEVEKVSSGVQVRLMGMGRDAVLIQAENGICLHLALPIADLIWVRPIQQK